MLVSDLRSHPSRFIKGKEDRPKRTERRERKTKNRIGVNAFLDDHAGDRTQNLSIRSRMPYHWATRPFLFGELVVYLVIKIDFLNADP